MSNELEHQMAEEFRRRGAWMGGSALRRGRRWGAALAVMALATVLLSACGDSGTNSAVAVTGEGADGGGTRKVTVVLDWTPNTNHSGLYLALAKGFYADAGLEVELIEPDANGGLAQLAAGNAQFAVTSAEYLLPARAEGADVVSVAAILAHNTSSLVIPADRGVKTAKDLEGKTYGGFGGPLEKALLDTMVSCAGGDPAKVNHVEVGNVDYRIGLDSKDYDAVWVFDGWDVIRLRDLEGMDITTLPFYGAGDASCVPDWYTPLLASSAEVAKEDPQLVQDFLAATAAGYELARTDPAEAAKALLAAAPELDAELVNRSAVFLADKYGDRNQPWGVQDADNWTTFAAFLVDAGLLKASVQPQEAFSNEFLPKADGS
ncbi:MAG: ABC transporter substrate-binding protein [Acidimicrobiales bacterium]